MGENRVHSVEQTSTDMIPGFEVAEIMTRVRTTDIVFTGLAFAVLYYLLRSAGQTPDGLSYALATRHGADMYHPHHLLYVPVTRFLFVLTGRSDPILAGVLHNLVWLVVAGLGAWRLAGRLRWSHGAALLAAGALLASRGVLFYSTHVETYLPALACLIMFTATWFKPSRSDLEAAAWLALAVLYHQTNVLLVVPILLTSDRRRPDFLRVALPAGLMVLVLYVVGWRLDGGEAGFVPWLLTYVQADVPAWGSAAHFSATGLAALGLSQLRLILPVPESVAGPGAVVLLTGIVLLAGYHLRQGSHRRERRFALVFLAVYLLFFLWWIPADPDFFLATLLPLWWLGVLLVVDYSPHRQGRWLVVPVVLLLAGNLWFTARPLNADPGPLHAGALRLHQTVDVGTPLIVGYGLEQELLYYTGRGAVYEGDALGLRLAGADRTDWPEGTVVVGQDYLQLVVSRRTDHDQALLRALLDYRDEGPTCRVYCFLPDGVGLLISEERRPTVTWDELQELLAAGAVI